MRASAATTSSEQLDSPRLTMSATALSKFLWRRFSGGMRCARFLTGMELKLSAVWQRVILRQLSRANGDRFRRMILSRGNTEDLADMYVAWRGKTPSIDAMMKYRELAPSR